MANSGESQIPAAAAEQLTAVQTNQQNVITIRPVTSYLLEMEDVLFHSGSAVIMPENPAGRNTSGQGQQNQMTVSGIRALALVFRKLKENSERAVLIAGHTDRSGDATANFALSEQRAKNVLYLLKGEKDNWADISAQKHVVDDYKQILKYYASLLRWDCDPGPVNSTWDAKTKKAIENFILLYNTMFAFKPIDHAVPDNIIDDVQSDSNKKWPKAIWEAVFYLYDHELIQALVGKNIADDEFNGLRAAFNQAVTRIDVNKPIVGCGESFPLSPSRNANSRSQQDSRVEILVFEKDDLPMLTCPDRLSSVHTAEECPLWNDMLHRPVYIDPATYFTATYHLQFTYFDYIYSSVKKVPDGLSFKAWRDGTTELRCESSYDAANGIYTLTVHGITDSPRQANIHFTFEAPNKWIFSNDRATNPVIKELLLPDYTDLPALDQLKHVDLPARWDSRNWSCQLNGTNDEFVKLNLQPTSSTGPIIFCLDDVVLVDENMNPIPWHATNRVTVFSKDMLIGNPETDKPYWTNGTFNVNYLPVFQTGRAARVVALKGDFFDATTKRTTIGQVLGARAATKNDTLVHAKAHCKEPVTAGAGHFDLHYFPGCIDASGAPCSVLMIYWSCKLTKGSITVGDADVNNFRKTGMIKAKERWEEKRYYFNVRQDPANKRIKVIPIFFFEDNPLKSSPHCIVKIQNPTDPDFRSSMGISSANFALDTFEEDTSDAGAAEDNGSFFWFTMAHELGHGTGLDDEYIESIEEDNRDNLEEVDVWAPVLPAFSQYYPGMPYECDAGSMMVNNRAPRLRHLWYFCRWLNETAAVKTLTENSLFEIAHEGTQNATAKHFRYFLEEAVKNYYKPVHEEKPAANGGHGKFDLHLYQLGNDETTDEDYVPLVPGKSGFDGILAVLIKIDWHFSADHGQSWAINAAASPKVHEKLMFLKKVEKKAAQLCNRLYALECPLNRDLKKIALLFRLMYSYSGNAAGRHFKITVKANDGTAVPYEADYMKTGFSNSTFTMDETQDVANLMRYLLGVPPYQVVNNPDGTQTKTALNALGAADLGFLAAWVQNKTGSANAYTVQ
jgi:hypothetical protein